MPEFDVVVLGGGTSGVLVASDLARAGRSVAVVEAGLAGGVSPYLACMPSTSLLASARRGETWEHAVARRDEVTGRLDDRLIADRLTGTGVTLVRGTGQVAEPGVVEVAATARGNGRGRAGASVLGYRDLVIATGAEPVAPPIEGLTDIPAWTSAAALSSPDLPRRLIVLGAGPAGCELAQIYAAFGSQVTLVEAEPEVLPDEVPFAGEILAGALRRAGVDLRLGSPVVKAEALDHGHALILADGTSLEGDRLLLATGRRPRLSGLGLGHLGIVPSAAGALVVDATCRVLAGGMADAVDHRPGGTGRRAGLGGGRRHRGRALHAHGPVPGGHRHRQHPGPAPGRRLPGDPTGRLHFAVCVLHRADAPPGRGSRDPPAHGWP